MNSTRSSSAPDPATAPSVAIIGTGFGGLGMAIRLKQAGYRDVVLFEKGDDVGGVWRDNTYPGAECDVPAHLYSFSFAPKADWSRRFPPQSEIRAYLQDCAHRFGVLEQVRFRSEVTSAAFDEQTGRWTLALDDGSTYESDVLVSAVGQLSVPSTPPLPGLDTFTGTAFHSARWRHDHDLTGRRVAVVGTGASAIQFVPKIRRHVAELSLFQLDAPHIIAKPDFRYSAAVTAAFRALPGLQKLSRLKMYWQYESRALSFTKFPAAMKLVDRQATSHLRSQISDPHLRAKVWPNGPPGCKRILMSDDYYPSLAADNVNVVTDRITEVRPFGVVTDDGTEHEVDTIIFGTGFQATEFLTPMTVTGTGGRDLRETWREGAEAHLGMSVSGFPNLFLLYGPNTNLGHNSIIFMLERQIGYVLQCLHRLAAGDIRWMEVREGTQRRFNRWVHEKIKTTVFDRGCMSWYKTASGKNTNNWPGSTIDYRARTRKVRFADFHLETGRPVS